MKRFLKTFAKVVLIVVALLVITPELWLPSDYSTQFREFADSPPSHRFPLGTDALGRDRLVRLVYGTRVSLLLAPSAALLSSITAALLGGLAALSGGAVEWLILACADLFLSLPWLFLLLTVRAVLPLNVSAQVSVAVTFLLLGVLGWAAPARVVFAAVRKLKDCEFILQAHAAGVRPWPLLWKQMTPNVLPILLAQFCVAVPVYVLAEATLGMLGLGVTEPLPSWGSMLRELEAGSVMDQPWLLAPVVVLAAVVGCFQCIRPKTEMSETEEGNLA